MARSVAGRQAPTVAAEPLLDRLAALTGHLVVALVALVVIGGATRVMQAGLACPDWPLCYGQWLPGGQLNLQVFLEWFHRLDAFVVGVALLVLGVTSVWARRSLPRWLPVAALLALLLVAVQGGLGALTVTHLLAAPLVTAHLATALLLVGLLSGVHQALRAGIARRSIGPAAPLIEGAKLLPRWWIALLALSLLVLLGQCLLGGTLASTWAADRCLAAAESCGQLLRHRLTARAAGLAVLLLGPASLAVAGSRGWLRRATFTAGLLVILQIALGVATLRLHLAVPAVTIAHQSGAALLVALLAGCLGRSLAACGSAELPISPSSERSPMDSATAPCPVEVAHG